MVKQCHMCHATFSLYKNWVTTDDQLTCERCAKMIRENHDRDQQHRRDLEGEQAARRLSGEIKQTICSIQSAVLSKQAEEKAKATIAEEERKSKESENERRIKEEETRQKEIEAQIKQSEENSKIRIAEEKRKEMEACAQRDIKVAEEATKQKELELRRVEEVTKQKELELQIARLNVNGSDTEFQNQLKLKECDLKIAKQKCIAEDLETRKVEAELRLNVFQSMDERNQQRFSEAFGNRLHVEHENLAQSGPARRRRAPWTALHCTLNN